MFGYSFTQLYFMINMLYTIIMFFFLHNIIAEKIFKNHHKLTSSYMTDKEVQISMNIFYIIGPLIGSIRLLKDVLNLIFDHKTCIWLHRIYEKETDEEKTEERKYDNLKDKPMDRELYKEDFKEHDEKEDNKFFSEGLEEKQQDLKKNLDQTEEDNEIQNIMSNLLKSDPLGAYVELKRILRREEINLEKSIDDGFTQQIQRYISVITYLMKQLEKTRLVTIRSTSSFSLL